jgi:transposase
LVWIFGPCDHERILLPHLQGVVIDAMAATSRGVTISAHCADQVRGCPGCETPTSRVRGRYERTLVDVPAACREVVVHLRVRRFRCTNPDCPISTFAEQVPGLTSR